VILEHRKLERFGDRAQTMKAMFEAQGAWIGTLTAMAQEAERHAVEASSSPLLALRESTGAARSPNVTAAPAAPCS